MTDINVSILSVLMSVIHGFAKANKPLMHTLRRVASVQVKALQFSIQGTLADIQCRGNLPAIIIVLA